MIRWGTVTTSNAPLPEIERFAAWHLEAGAHRIYLYLDHEKTDGFETLSHHPKLRVIHTDEAWWAKRKGRPDKHQQRQSANARHANNRKAEVDWLAHIDTDEFILPAREGLPNVAEQLAALPQDCQCARIRPIEALAPGDANTPQESLFKALPADRQLRQSIARACFPQYGAYLAGGFLSHTLGKLFFRPRKGLQIRIHNVFENGVENPGHCELPGLELGHFHASSWEMFTHSLRYRLARGSYRAELKSAIRQPGALNLHDVLNMIEETDGLPGLRAFFNETCVADQPLCARLEAHGILRRHVMALETLRATYF